MMNMSCWRQVFLVIMGKWKNTYSIRQLIIDTIYGDCTLCMPLNMKLLAILYCSESMSSFRRIEMLNKPLVLTIFGHYDAHILGNYP